MTFGNQSADDAGCPEGLRDGMGQGRSGLGRWEIKDRKEWEEREPGGRREAWSH